MVGSMGKKRVTCAGALLLVVGLAITACSTTGTVTPGWRAQIQGEQALQVQSCAARFDQFDRLVGQERAQDAEAHNVPGFPYLRVSRFLASFRGEVADPVRLADWVERLRQLDRQGRYVETASLMSYGVAVAMSESEIDACGRLLMAVDLASAEARSVLVDVAVVPDHYTLWKRVLGLYPLSRIGAAWGFRRWQEDNLTTFGHGFKAAPAGSFTLYFPDSSVTPFTRSEVAALVDASRNNTLGIADIKGAELERLLYTYAPLWRLQTQTSSDRIGKPYWAVSSGVEKIQIDHSEVPVYARLAHARFRGEILPQLVYQIWLPERPKKGAFDLLGGSLDSVVWRVTLGLDGAPLVYDTMHACGCYQLYFPVPPIRRKPMPEDDDLREEALVPLVAPILDEGQRMVVQLATDSHYVSDIYSDSVLPQTDPSKTYGIHFGTDVPDEAMRLAPYGEAGRRRSLYGPDGVIRQSRRLERFTLWPMGVKSPGAMRQWGTHATAFVGKRHFDDPYLMEAAFE